MRVVLSSATAIPHATRGIEISAITIIGAREIVDNAFFSRHMCALDWEVQSEGLEILALN